MSKQEPAKISLIKESFGKLNLPKNMIDYINISASHRDLENQFLKYKLDKFADDLDKQIRTGPPTTP